MSWSDDSRANMPCPGSLRQAVCLGFLSSQRGLSFLVLDPGALLPLLLPLPALSSARRCSSVQAVLSRSPGGDGGGGGGGGGGDDGPVFRHDVAFLFIFYTS